MGDGYCDDDPNNEDCNYDGGSVGDGGSAMAAAVVMEEIVLDSSLASRTMSGRSILFNLQSNDSLH